MNYALSPLRVTLLLVAVFSLLRLFAAPFVGLSVDEAHYALYGFYLDWSYFDHPPLVGWLQALVLPFSATDFAMRLAPVALFALSGLVLHQMCGELFPHDSPWLGTISVALLQSALMLQLLGFALVPDGPLLLFALLAVRALHAALQSQRTRDWLWLGLWLGLAGLAKYTAVTLIFTVLLALTFTRQWAQLRRPGPWLALLIGLLAIFPILYWNARHEWISFAYQLHHGTASPEWQIGRFAVAQAAQFVTYGPALFVFGLLALFYGWRERAERGVAMCLALGLPVLLLFGWNAGFVVTLPHWTSLGWVALAPLAARRMMRVWPQRGMRVLLAMAGGASLALVVLVFSQFIQPWMPFKDNADPLRDLYGWQQAAQRAETLRRQMAQNGSEAQLFTANWTHASRLAWYARPAPVQVMDNRRDQFDLWFAAPAEGASGILVVWPESSPHDLSQQLARFANCTLSDKLPVELNDHLVSTFSFYACTGFKR